MDRVFNARYSACTPSAKKRFKKNSGIILVGFSTSYFDDIINTPKKKRVKFYKRPKQGSFGKHAIIQDSDVHSMSVVQMPQEDVSQIPYYLGFAPA